MTTKPIFNLTLFDYLNLLDSNGTLSQLYRLGAVTLKCYNYREIVGVYRALLATPAYIDKPSHAAQVTADQCRVALRTVYRAIEQMEQSVS